MPTEELFGNWHFIVATHGESFDFIVADGTSKTLSSLSSEEIEAANRDFAAVTGVNEPEIVALITEDGTVHFVPTSGADRMEFIANSPGGTEGISMMGEDHSVSSLTITINGVRDQVAEDYDYPPTGNDSFDGGAGVYDFTATDDLWK